MVLKLCAPRARARALALAVLEPLYQNPLIPKTNSMAVLASGVLRRGAARVLSAGVLRPGVNLGHICTAHPRVVVRSWKARARARAGVDKARTKREEKEWVGRLRGRIEIYRSGQSLRRNSVND